jgi:hypothetical protein
MLFDVTVNYDGVQIAGVQIPKPGHVGAGAWLEFWETISELEHLKQERDDLRDKLTAALTDVKELTYDNERLRTRVAQLEDGDAE